MRSRTFFTVTHPFHPLHGRQFILLARRVAYGEWRVFFTDPYTGHVRSLPVAWTDQCEPDPFLELAAGRAILSFTQLQKLTHLLELFQARISLVKP
jgi:hypothetical protein